MSNIVFLTQFQCIVGQLKIITFAFEINCSLQNGQEKIWTQFDRTWAKLDNKETIKAMKTTYYGYLKFQLRWKGKKLGKFISVFPVAQST